MRIVIHCSDEERRDAQEVRDWIRDGEFEFGIDVAIEVRS